MDDDDPLFADVQPLLDTGPVTVPPSLKEFETGVAAAVVALPAKAAASAPRSPSPAPATSTRRAAAVGASPPAAEPTRVGPAAKPAKPAAPAAPEKGPFSVVISATKNPKAVPLVMQLLRVDEAEAKGLVLKPAIAVARNINRDAAVRIAGQFKALNVSVRITQAKG